MTEAGTLDPGAVFLLGAIVSALVWVPLGRWSLLLLMRRSWRAQQLRQLANPGHGREVARPYPRVQVEHAGQYVQHDRIRAGVCQLEPPESFTRVRCG